MGSVCPFWGSSFSRFRSAAVSTRRHKSRDIEPSAILEDNQRRTVFSSVNTYPKMVNFCAVCGCSNRANREKDRGFFRFLTILHHSDTQKKATTKTKDLSQERRFKWLARIRREDLTEDKIVNVRVCSDHFTSGKNFALLLY